MNQTTNLIKANDKIVSEIIHLRDPLCRLKLTGCTHYTDDPAHVWGRTNMATRWDLNAVYGSCRTCHSYADQHPKFKKVVFTVLMGKELYDSVKIKSNMNVKYLPFELKQIRKSLELDLRCVKE